MNEREKCGRDTVTLSAIDRQFVESTQKIERKMQKFAGDPSVSSQTTDRAHENASGNSTHEQFETSHDAQTSSCGAGRRGVVVL